MSEKRCHCPHGAGHWLIERFTALALAPLGLWFIYALVHLHDAPHDAVIAWLSAPVNAGLMAAFIVVAFWHGALGSQVIVEDYIHVPWFKKLKLIGIKVFSVALTVLCLLAVYEIVF